jgi:DNA primase
MSIAQEIKDRLDIVDVISDYLPLKRSGRNLSGFCPFHSNTRTPAFFVSPERQTWKCFGACAEGGDIFSFVMKREGLDFREALELLARRAGVEIPVFNPKSPQDAAVEDRLSDLLESAADYFHHLLLYAPEAEAARQYVRSRGLYKRTVEQFKLGYSLSSYDACRSHFEGQGYSSYDLIDAGLLTENEEKQRVYDRFRNRLMFPIWDAKGKVVGFGARTLEKDGVPKYLNSPQTELFDKSHLLYGLNFGKRDIREARQAVIVEGYMDVIRAHERGFKNVVAQMGTALTEHQMRLLKRYTKHFMIALDADEAGVSAALQGLKRAVDLDGLIKIDDSSIHVLKLPQGYDPDDLIAEDAARWAEMLQNEAISLGDFVIQEKLAGIDLADSTQVSTTAREIIEIIEKMPDPAKQNYFIEKLARNLGMNERDLRKIVPRKRRTYEQKIVVGRSVKKQALLTSLKLDRKSMIAPLATEPMEANYLRHALEYPALMVKVDLRLQNAQQPTVTRDDFTNTEDQALWNHLRRRAVSAGRGQFVSISELCDSLDGVLVSRIETLLTLTASKLDEQLAARMTHSVLNWRLDKVKRHLSEVKQLVDEAQQLGNADEKENYSFRCQELTMMIYSINQAKHGLSSTALRDD